MKRKVHSLIDKVYSLRNLELAWEKVKKNRGCQQALVQRMEPIFEPTLLGCNFGYRKGRSPHDAMRKVWRELQDGKVWIVDADLRQFFDTIPQQKLLDLVAEEISDG